MKKLLWIIAVIVAIGALTFYFVRQSQKPGQYDALAQCIEKSGTKFYGAWWCPHCQAQKAFFGKSAKLLPYVECQTPDQKQNQTCNDAGIKGYPTWVFPDGSRITGEQKPAELAAKTNCPL